MKRIFLLALATSMLVTVGTAFCSCGDDVTDTTTTTNTSEEEEKDSLSFALNANGISYRVIGIGTYKDSDVVIPNTYNSLPVTEIADGAFEGCKTITGVTVPYGITSIGAKAFKGCAAITKINISHTVTSVGAEAFSGCEAITERVDGVLYVGKWAIGYESDATE